MKYLIIIISLVAFVLLTSQRSTSSTWLPYQGKPMSVQIWDTNGVEISYIFYDPATRRTVVRGSLEDGLKQLNQVYDNTLVPAQELNYAASRVRKYLTASGTVIRRDSLTRAIRYYDSVKAKWGIIE